MRLLAYAVLEYDTCLFLLFITGSLSVLELTQQFQIDSFVITFLLCHSLVLVSFVINDLSKRRNGDTKFGLCIIGFAIISGHVRNGELWHVRNEYHKGGVGNGGRWNVEYISQGGVSGMEAGGMFGIHTAKGTGTPWLIRISGMILTGWEVHKCSLYSLYKPPVSP